MERMRVCDTWSSDLDERDVAYWRNPWTEESVEESEESVDRHPLN